MTPTELADLLFYHFDGRLPENLNFERYDAKSEVLPFIWSHIESRAEALAEIAAEDELNPYKPFYQEDLIKRLNKYVAELVEETYAEAMPIYRAMLNDTAEADRVSAHCKGYL